MPKWPCSSGPVRNELSCGTVIDKFSRHAIDLLCRSVARCLDEGAYLIRVLRSGRALDAGGNIDARGARDAQSLADIAGIEAARKHERHTGIEIFKQMPVERFAEPARPRRRARRAGVEQQ